MTQKNLNEILPLDNLIFLIGIGIIILLEFYYVLYNFFLSAESGAGKTYFINKLLNLTKEGR